jgi:hypothetical protein
MGNLFRQYWLPVVPVEHLEKKRPQSMRTVGADQSHLPAALAKKHQIFAEKLQPEWPSSGFGSAALKLTAFLCELFTHCILQGGSGFDHSRVGEHDSF